jgi:putative membrane protein
VVGGAGAYSEAPALTTAPFLSASRCRNMAQSDRTPPAEDRTDLAEDRTVLANERTFAGWLRTGMTAVGIALGFQALFSRMEPDWVPKAISTVFLLTAIYIFWSSERRAAAVCRRLEAHQVDGPRGANLRLTTAVMIGAATALIAAIWLLRIEVAA